MLQNAPGNSPQAQLSMERAAYINMITQGLKESTKKKETKRAVKRLTDIGNPDIDRVAVLGYD